MSASQNAKRKTTSPSPQRGHEVDGTRMSAPTCRAVNSTTSGTANRQSRLRFKRAPQLGHAIQLQREMAQTRHGMNRAEHSGQACARDSMASYDVKMTAPPTLAAKSPAAVVGPCRLAS